MILPPLTGHLAVCSLAEVPRILSADHDFRHVLSLRDPARPMPHLLGTRSVRAFYFDEVEIVQEGEGSGAILFSEAQSQGLWRHVEPIPVQPLLIHCVAGLSRSTAVTAAIIARALDWEGLSPASVAHETVDRLLQVRPPA